MNATDFLNFVAGGVNTTRFHTVPTIRAETVGHHHGIVMALLVTLFPQASAPLLRYAALHDFAEHVTGDVPSTTKKHSPEIKAIIDAMEDEVILQAGVNLVPLTSYERHIFKRVDYVAGMITCYTEWMLGNRIITQAFHNFRLYYQHLQWDPIAHQEDGCRILDEMVSKMATAINGS